MHLLRGLDIPAHNPQASQVFGLWLVPALAGMVVRAGRGIHDSLHVITCLSGLRSKGNYYLMSNYIVVLVMQEDVT